MVAVPTPASEKVGKKRGAKLEGKMMKTNLDVVYFGDVHQEGVYVRLKLREQV